MQNKFVLNFLDCKVKFVQNTILVKTHILKHNLQTGGLLYKNLKNKPYFKKNYYSLDCSQKRFSWKKFYPCPILQKKYIYITERERERETVMVVYTKGLI